MDTHSRSLIDKNGTYRYSPCAKKGVPKATLQRAERAIDELGNETPFLLVYYGTDGSGGWQRVIDAAHYYDG